MRCLSCVFVSVCVGRRGNLKRVGRVAITHSNRNAMSNPRVLDRGIGEHSRGTLGSGSTLINGTPSLL